VEYEFSNANAEGDKSVNVPEFLRDPNPLPQSKINALKKLRGTRLAPLEKLLAPHPISIITTTIASSSAMLGLLFTIK